MIDKIKIGKRIKLDTDKFHKKMYHQKVEKNVNKKTGEIYPIDCYKCKIFNNISVIYSNLDQTLTIEGRLINANFVNNRVYNYDDYIRPRHKQIIETETIEHDEQWQHENSWYDGDDNLCFPDSEEIIVHEDILDPEFMEETLSYINSVINILLGTRTRTEKKGKPVQIGEETFYEKDVTIIDRIDIREFDVKNVEICFNIWLKNDYVDDYIMLFNHIFKVKDNSSYTNYTLEENKPTNTSYYVKTKSSYEANVNNNYTINFYNKLNQLENEKNKKNGYKVTQEDLALAEACLRLEVQLYYRGLTKLEKDYDMNRNFKNLLDLDLCFSIIKEYYERFIDYSDSEFYSYKEAKSIIQDTMDLSTNDKKNLLNHIRERQQYNKKHSNQTRNKYNKMLRKLNIASIFIPTSYGIDCMKSPITLLNQKLDYYKIKRTEFEKGTLKSIRVEEFKSY